MNAPAPAAPRTAVFYSTIRHWPWGAPDYVWPRAAAELARRGVPVIAVVRPHIWDRPEIRALATLGAQVFLQPPLVYSRGRLSQLKLRWLQLTRSTRPLRRALRRAPRPHFIVEQSGSYDFLDEPFLRQAIAETAATYDVFFRSNRYDSPLALEQRRLAIAFLDRANRNLFNSEWTREMTELQLVHRLANARYFSHLVRFPHDEPLPWPAGDTIRLASVSRIDCHHKGLDVLLQALARLPATLPPWTLDLYGHGPDEAYLRDLAQWLGLQERVRFRSSVDDIRAVWQENHLLVLISRYEGLAVSMLEALACGRPVLRTPYGGFSEWITPDETGFLCPAPEPQLIAGSLEHAMRSFAKWLEMGRAGHARIRAKLHGRPETVFLEPFETATP